MSNTEKIFLVRVSLEEDRPWIDFQMEENRRNDWLLLDEVLRGERPASEYPPVRVIVNHPEAELWDYYSMVGPFGMLSERSALILGSFALPYFELCRATLNRSPYFILKAKKPLDCLNHEESILVPFPHDTTRVMDIEKFRFFKEKIKDPSLFTIPEGPWLFATQTIDARIRQWHLRGFRLIDTDT